MYEHVTGFIEDIDSGSFDAGAFVHAQYNPEIVDYNYRETLASRGIVNPRETDIESLDLAATLAVLTFVHRDDRWNPESGVLEQAVESGFLRRLLVRLRKLDPGAARERKPNVIGFFHDYDEYGFCSNWYASPFTFRGWEFATVEHWMMWQKACVMGDWGMASRILEETNPSKVKKLGRQVKYGGVTDWNDEHKKLWNSVSGQLVYYGVREKFLQNPHLAEELLATGNAVLAEANPRDPIWGVGISVRNRGFADMSGWKGENHLGRALMRVRADLGMLAKMGIPAGSLADFGAEQEIELLESPLGEMTLLELSRNPVTRGAVLCYATIAQYAARDTYTNVKDFLQKAGRDTIVELDLNHAFGTGGEPTPAGWYELAKEVVWLRSTGRV